MKLLLLTVIAALPFHALAGHADGAGGGDAAAGRLLGQQTNSECEEAVEGGRSLQKLVQSIVKGPLDERAAYRLRVKVKELPRSALTASLERFENSVSRFGADLHLLKISASGGSLILDFRLQGYGRTIVQALMEIGEQPKLGDIELTTVSWSEFRPEPPPPRAAPVDPPSEAEFNRLMRRKISELELSVRSETALKTGKGEFGARPSINYVGDLVQKSEMELLRIQGLGRKSAEEIKEVLALLGLKLGTEVPGWPYEDLE